MSRSKLYKQKSELVQEERLYSPKDAVSVIKKMPVSRFDETVEVHFNLGIDPRHAEQQIRGTMVLPHGTGRTARVVAIVDAEKVAEAKEAGADHVGSDEIIEKIEKGWFDFDVVIALPSMMAKVGRLGKVLGGKGLMPNPKTGTVTQDVAKAIKEFKSGKVEYRNDKYGNIHLGIAKLSFSEDKIEENFAAIFEVIEKAKPSKAKGIYMRTVTLTTTMGPGLRVEPMKIRWKETENG